VVCNPKPLGPSRSERTGLGQTPTFQISNNKQLGRFEFGIQIFEFRI